MVIFDFLKKHVSEMVAMSTEILYNSGVEVFYNNYKTTAMSIIAYCEHPLAKRIAEAARKYNVDNFGKFIRYLDMQLGKATAMEIYNLEDSLQKWLENNELFDSVMVSSDNK